MPRIVGWTISSSTRFSTASDEHRGRRVGAHAAGVLAAVAVERPLVILGGGEGHDVLAVGDRVVGGLLALEPLLDHDALLRPRRSAASPMISSSAALGLGRASSQTATPLPAARPSAFTTQGPPSART